MVWKEKSGDQVNSSYKKKYVDLNQSRISENHYR